MRDLATRWTTGAVYLKWISPLPRVKFRGLVLRLGSDSVNSTFSLYQFSLAPPGPHRRPSSGAVDFPPSRRADFSPPFLSFLRPQDQSSAYC